MAWQRAKQTSTIKILLLGDSSVGKSCLLNRYHSNTFSDLQATIAIDFKMRNWTPPGSKHPYKVQIWDTAGQEKYRTILQSYYRNTLACVLVFDLTSDESFRAVETWSRELDKACGVDDILKVLVGNKKDLVEQNPEERKVSRERGMGMAARLGCRYFEASASQDEKIGNVKESFEYLFNECSKRMLDPTYLPPLPVVDPALRDLAVNIPKEEKKGCCGKG
jgi:small GTP-binding protein